MTIHPEFYPVAIGFIFLLAAFSLIISSWMASHGLEQRLADRIDRNFKQSPQEAQAAKAVVNLGDRVVTAIGLMRRFFALGADATWGMRAGPVLIPLAAVGGLCTWALVHLLLHLPFWVSLPAAMAGGFALPHFVLTQQQENTEGHFNEMFPNAIDMIVRMLRAGLPVTHAIRTVGHEMPTPVGPVFTKIADQVEIGMPLEQALEMVGQTISLPDFRFFVVSAALQRATGGNLAASLETMATIVRQRRAVRMKGMAATAEVRVSAIILGMLPFIIVGGLLLTNPHYLDPLVHDPRGNIVIGIALTSLLLGGLVMRAMIHSISKP